VSSITYWTRLEPRSRDAEMADGLKAQMRDALWLLARQWQVCEFCGHDAGFPVKATVGIERAPLTGYRHSAAPGPAPVAFDPGLPLEAHVERETVALETRGSVQLGLYFEAALRGSTIANAAQLVLAFRGAYSIAPASANPAYEDIPDVAGAQFLNVVAGRVTDGQALYRDAKATLPAQPANLPAAAQPVFAPLRPILQEFVTYVDSLYDQPSGDSAWSPRPPQPSGACDVGWLRYEFSVASRSDRIDATFQAPEFRGGRLDWYAFSALAETLDTGAPVPTQVEYQTLLPTHVTFRGMPTGGFWQFEDGMADWGDLHTNQVDLATMLVTEFAVLYGGDWFTVPVQLPFGALSRIAMVVVTDTFGQRTLVRPTGAETPAGNRPWTMFTISGEATQTDLLFLPPTLGAVQDGPAVEAVDFLRDDMAALGWAVERTLPGPLDAPVDGYEWYLARVKREPPPDPPTATPGGAGMYYLLGTVVPDNWIPLVPEQTAQDTARFLRRGAMARLNPAPPPDTLAVTPRGQILDPANPLFLSDQAVPQGGLQVERYFRRARWIDGSTHVWIARRVRPGHGPGVSGLAFDLVKPLKPA
jgi:hypothetical protein